MRKYIALLTFFTLLFSGPAYALKVKNPINWGVAKPAKVNSIDNALEVFATVDRMYSPYYIANLNCHEYSRIYTLKSSEGYTYVRPRSRTVRISREPSIFLRQLFKENEGNIYFKAYGFGLYGNFVGEFFIGNKSVSKYMIEKGYCDYVQ